MYLGLQYVAYANEERTILSASIAKTNPMHSMWLMVEGGLRVDE